MTKQDHHNMQKCLDNGLRIFSNQQRQIVVERNGVVEKTYNTKTKDNIAERIALAYAYYLESF